MRAGLAQLDKRLQVLERAVGRVLFVLIAEWDVVLIQHLQMYTPETWERCVAIQQEENRRLAAVFEALSELEQEALAAGDDHLTLRVYGSQRGLVRIKSSRGAYELDVPCLPGSNPNGPTGPMVFVSRTDDVPGVFKAPEWGASKQRYLARYRLKG